MLAGPPSVQCENNQCTERNKKKIAHHIRTQYTNLGKSQEHRTGTPGSHGREEFNLPYLALGQNQTWALPWYRCHFRICHPWADTWWPMSHPFGSSLIPAMAVLNDIIPPKHTCVIHFPQKPVESMWLTWQAPGTSGWASSLGDSEDFCPLDWQLWEVFSVLLRSPSGTQPPLLLPSVSSPLTSHSCLPGLRPTTLLWAGCGVPMS